MTLINESINESMSKCVYVVSELNWNFDLWNTLFVGLENDMTQREDNALIAEV